MRVASRNEGLLVQFCAKVTGVRIYDDLTCVLGCAQELLDDFVEPEPLWTAKSMMPFTGAPSVTSTSAATTSSDRMGWITAEGTRTVCPSSHFKDHGC